MASCKMTPRKCVRSILLLTLVTIILLNLHYLSPSRDSASDDRVQTNYLPRLPRTTNLSFNDRAPNTSEVKVDIVQKSYEESVAQPPVAVVLSNHSTLNLKEKVLDSSEQRQSQFNESLSAIITDINSKQAIRNVDRFPPTAGNGSYRHVFAVQVHNRDHYLQYLVDSLRTTRDVNTSLLIVSHDFYTKQVFDIIKSIDFMPVLQIFYPLAMQLYHNKYPGPDPKDCARDVKKPQALTSGCINAAHPDKYGHYREAAYSQTKLHWFWKLHHIFDGLAVMKGFTGYVTLIEEDHFLTPDALYMLNKMIEAQPKLCPGCRILTLGNYDKKPVYAYTSEVVVAADFISSKHNMAMSMTRQTYQLIKQHHKEFCDYDDYNWDWSLQYIGREIIPGKLPTMIVKTPRVYHIGDCGVHHKGKKCNPQEKAKPILDRVAANRDQLFPTSLKIGKATSATNLVAKKLKANGGWGDQRDHELCSSFMT